jgi:formyltetrahydrofolate deformylase
VETSVRLSRRPGAPHAKRAAGEPGAEIRRLLITCPDRPGIVAAVSNFLAACGANITESQQYSTDPFGGTFFLRLEFHADAAAGPERRP